MKKTKVFFERMVRLEERLKAENPEMFKKQKHLDKGESRNYWHYGYLMAMKDIFRNFELKEKQ